MGKIIILLFVLPMSSFSYVWNPAYYGEKNNEHYFGVMGGDFKASIVSGEIYSFGSGIFIEKDEFYGQMIIKGESKEEFYIEDKIQGDLFSLLDDIKDIKRSLICPQDEMSKNYEYYRYLYRLIAISYLYESLKFHNLTARKLDVNGACEIDFKRLFKSCTPSSTDMKFFLKNVEVVLATDQKELIPFDHNVQNFKKSWLTKYTNESFEDVSQSRINIYCNDHDCQLNDKKKLKQVFNNICKEDEKLMSHICSEQDQIYGMSNIIYGFNLIKDTDALLAVNDEGFAKGCLRRFSIQNNSKELDYKILKNIFPTTYDYLKKNFEDRFLQGQLFPLGSLKIFRDQGLTDLLLTQEKTQTKIEKVMTKVPEKKLPPLAPEPLEPFLKKKKIVKKKEPDVKKIPPKTLSRSHFLQAVNIREEYSLMSQEVEMDKLKFDYIFTPKMTKVLEKTLKRFTTFSGLQEMKKFDSLGTPDGAVPLRFIKFLIDSNNHQALFNIVEVLGDKFYVFNDIDDKSLVKVPNYIKIENNHSTNYQWQIYILND